jgi:hypothetical protein
MGCWAHAVMEGWWAQKCLRGDVLSLQTKHPAQSNDIGSKQNLNVVRARQRRYELDAIILVNGKVLTRLDPQAFACFTRHALTTFASLRVRCRLCSSVCTPSIAHDRGQLSLLVYTRARPRSRCVGTRLPVAHSVSFTWSKKRAKHACARPRLPPPARGPFSALDGLSC